MEFAPEAFDAVVAFYSIIHVPRDEQPELVRRIHRWLKPGGRFLANWALDAWEGEKQDWEGWGARVPPGRMVESSRRRHQPGDAPRSRIQYL